MIRLDLIVLLLIPALLTSCSTATGRPHSSAVFETTCSVESKSPGHLFMLKKRKKEDGFESYFCNGLKLNKAVFTFPLLAKMTLMSKKQGELLSLKLRSYRQDLFLNLRKRDSEDKWRSAISFYLHSIQPNS